MFQKMSRDNILCFAALAVFVVATTLVANTDAATYTVGDPLGWTIPSNADVYKTYASQNTFFVGDILVFNFPTGQHDVAPVSKEAYDACNSSAAIQLLTIGPASVTLTSAGTQYYICTFGRHCVAGQKLAVTVAASSSSPLPSPPPITPSPTPLPPTPSSAPPPIPSSAPPPTLLPGTPSPSSIPPSGGPGPSGPAEGPSPIGSEGPSPIGSEGPSPIGSASPPSPGSNPAPGSLPGDADGSAPPPPSSAPPPPSSASKTGVATIFVGMFISAAIGYMF